MHQTFYIDIDEEITSIIERLKKSSTKEIVIVVPKRALLIQSIISLKLLKKEADRLKKTLILVTQDKLGKLLIEKAGIIVEQKLNEVEEDEEQPALDERRIKPEEILEKGPQSVKVDFEEIGSGEYFDEAPKKNRRQSFIKEKTEAEERIVNKELVTEFDSVLEKKFFFKKNTPSMEGVRNIDISQKGSVKEEAENIEEAAEDADDDKIFRKKGPAEDFITDKVDNFFENSYKYKRKKEKEEYKELKVGGKAWKIFFWFCFLAVVGLALVGSYLFLPQVDITLYSKAENKSIDTEIKGLGSVETSDPEKMILPVKFFEEESELTQEFESTGDKSGSTQKARGVITIYNEFDSSPQSLVATTRFLSEDGKLFRLDKSIVVPGTTQVGEEIKPGAIEADVTADEAGEQFNIGPGKFSIPGFKNSANGKYEKIYAKSSKAMAGGGNKVANSAKSVSASDIVNAKNKISTELIAGLKQKIKDRVGMEHVFLDDAFNLGEVVYSVSSPEGAAASKFSVTGKIKGGALAFREKDIQELAIYKLVSVSGRSQESIDKDSLKIEFGKADSDFINKTLLIRAGIKSNLRANLDSNQVKKDILGKSEEEFMAYLKRFKDIERAELNYWPPFFAGKIPQYEKRINLTLDNN